MKVYFPVRGGLSFRSSKKYVKAVDGVSFDVIKGETLGLVGESGCGKSTTGRAILQLHEVNAGHVWFEDTELTSLRNSEMRRMRRRLQMVFQDPFGSLNPRKTVGQTIAEPLHIHELAQGKAQRERVRELLTVVGLDPSYASRYPHEFSGGQRQRIGIARALAVEPEFIVADEPISALDVSIQAQIINLLEHLQEAFSLTYLFIAHDLSVVRHTSTRVAVMYLGKIVEIGDRDGVFEGSLHPYTRALLSAVPVPDPVEERTRERIILQGDVPSPVDPPSGCRFRTRCWKAQQVCTDVEPPLVEHSRGHWAACHFPETGPTSRAAAQ